MKAHEFESVFNQNGFIWKHFQGVHSIDTAPPMLNDQCFIILNTELSRHFCYISLP